jgi:CheY-like chemotaxis protein
MFPIRENHDLNRESSQKGNVLVLDSDKVRQQVNATVLRQSFVVWSANNDDEAIDLVDTQRVDLIILNLNLNEDTTSGWGFLSVLWSDEKGKDIPVIVLTLSSELTFTTDYWQVSKHDVIEITWLLYDMGCVRNDFLALPFAQNRYSNTLSTLTLTGAQQFTK